MSLVIILYRHFRTCLVHPNRLVIVMFGLAPDIVIIKPECKQPLSSLSSLNPSVSNLSLLSSSCPSVSGLSSLSSSCPSVSEE